MLREIWNVSNVRSDNQLTLDRFCVAMRLVSIGQNTQLSITQESLFVTKDQQFPRPNIVGIEDIIMTNSNNIPSEVENIASEDKFAALNSIGDLNDDPVIAPMMGLGSAQDGGDMMQQQNVVPLEKALVPTQQPTRDNEEEGADEDADADDDDFGEFADATPSKASSTSGSIDLDTLMMSVTPTIPIPQEMTNNAGNSGPVNLGLGQSEEENLKMKIIPVDSVHEVVAALDPFSSLAAFGSSESSLPLDSRLPQPQVHQVQQQQSPADFAAIECFEEALNLLEGQSHVVTIKVEGGGRTAKTLTEMKSTIHGCCRRNDTNNSNDQDDSNNIVQMFDLCFAPLLKEASSQSELTVDILRNAVHWQRRAASLCDIIVGLNSNDGIHQACLGKWLPMLKRAEKEFTTCLKVLSELNEAQNAKTIVSYENVMKLPKFERYLDGLSAMWCVVQSLQTDIVFGHKNQALLHMRAQAVSKWQQVCTVLGNMGRPQQYSSSPKDGELQVLKLWTKETNFQREIQHCNISLCSECPPHCISCCNLKNQCVSVHVP